MFEGSMDIILGLQMGDEGKGRFTHQLAQNYELVARFNGGANAGHTFSHNGEEINTHQIPSGIVHGGVMNLLTLSSYVDPVALLEEAEGLAEKGIEVSKRNLMVSNGAQLVLPHHIMLDEIREAGAGGQGSTKRGISPVAAQKYDREGFTLVEFLHDRAAVEKGVRQGVANANRRIIGLSKDHHELKRSPVEEWNRWQEAASMVMDMSGNTVAYVHQELREGARLLAEGAQSVGLDIEHGARRETTSSHVTVGGALNSIGVGPQAVDEVYGVAKLTPSRVGGTADSSPTLIEDNRVADSIRGVRGLIDSEFGKSTGRERQMSWLDLGALRMAVRVNGVTQLALTKLDCVPRSGAVTKVAKYYIDENREPVDLIPNNVHLIKRLIPIYEEMPTWKEDISRITDYESLPENAKKYIELIENNLDNTQVTMIGVGPEPNQLVTK